MRIRALIFRTGCFFCGYYLCQRSSCITPSRVIVNTMMIVGKQSTEMGSGRCQDKVGYMSKWRLADVVVESMKKE